MSIGTGIAGSAISTGMSNAMSSANYFHDFESDNSALFGVLDPAGTLLGHLNARGEKKATKKQRKQAEYLAALQYHYQKLAALEMPSLMRKGYEDAGYNALLALGQTGGATNASLPSDGSSYPHRINKVDAKLDSLLLGQLRQQEAQLEKTKTETTSKKVDTIVDAVQALGHLGLGWIGLKYLKGKNGKAAKALAPTITSAMPPSAKSVSPSKLASASTLSSSLGAGGISAAAALLYTGLQMYIGKQIEGDILSGKQMPSAVNKNELRHRTSGLGTSPKTTPPVIRKSPYFKHR